MTTTSSPIFVHASPRSGSTYFFHVLRRNAALMCFNESINDAFGYWGKEGISGFSKRVKWDTNHQFLDRDDFAEIIGAWDEVMPFYPAWPVYRNYVPREGRLDPALHRYMAELMNFAVRADRTPAFCEIYTRCRAGAMRAEFGGLHIAQYRDPLSQFGSYFRALSQGGEWYFLVFPVMELGISGASPLYELIPEKWRLPVLPWPRQDSGRRWATAAEYAAIAGSTPQAIESLLRWHLFSWLLGNLAAICFADLVLDLDRIDEDAVYRSEFTQALAATRNVACDFSDLQKYPRHFAYEGVDAARICSEIEEVVGRAVTDGRLPRAVAALSSLPLVRSVDTAFRMLVDKMCQAVDQLAMASDAKFVTARNWQEIVESNRSLWWNPSIRRWGAFAYPFAAPLLQAVRRMRAQT